MYILGLNAYHPDSSACIIKDGALLAAFEEERFSRIKHWAGFPAESISGCLEIAGISAQELDYVALNRDPGANLLKKASFVLRKRPSYGLIANRARNVLKIKGINETFADNFSVSREDAKKKIRYIEHHRAHLASSFFVSVFKEAAVVSLDGFGDFSSCMISRGIDNKLKIISEVCYPYSLGIFYTCITQFLGFKSFGDEYKVMGLSAYGTTSYLKEMKDILILKPAGKFILNPEYFSFYKRGDLFAWDNAAPVIRDVYSPKLMEKLGAPRADGEKLTDRHYDLAASLQAAYEEAFFHILNHAHKTTGSFNLCLAGGCALNSLANGKIFDRTDFKEVYIPPAPSDAGGAIGSALYLYHQQLGKERIFVMEHAYWGNEFDDAQIERQLDSYREEFAKYSCKLIKVSNEAQLCQKTALEISAGLIVGWFQGRMEWGPRALGNRSILADPRKREIKDVLNARIKRREWFRPFAPAVLLEDVGEYFEKNYPDPFMLKVYRVREDKRALIPAVVHVDATGRLQTVEKKQNPLFWRLINEFKALTGIGVLLNTSFNENEPIVCRPQEAIECFLRTKMDVLVIGSYMIRKG